jgi:hypothetical protein
MKRISWIFAIVLALVFSSCDTSTSPSTMTAPANPFLGTWVYHSEDEANNCTIWLTFNSDGTFNFVRKYFYYDNDWSNSFDGTYSYDDRELNFIYTYDNKYRDNFQRYKFYETYLRILTDPGGFISIGEYYKQ